jgi:predicted transcriptional regulator YdeE
MFDPLVVCAPVAQGVYFADTMLSSGDAVCYRVTVHIPVAERLSALSTALRKAACLSGSRRARLVGMSESSAGNAASRWQVSYVDRTPRLVDYIEVDDVPAALPDAWQRLEATVGDLRGRHFVGAFYPSSGHYRACVEVEQSDPTTPGLSRGEIPGGRYARIRLRAEPPALYEQIPATFARLVAECNVDAGRPSLELYRRHDQVDALVPVTSG